MPTTTKASRGTLTGWPGQAFGPRVQVPVEALQP